MTAGGQCRALRPQRRAPRPRGPLHARDRGADPRRPGGQGLHEPRRRVRHLGGEDDARPAAPLRLDAVPARREAGEAVARVEPLPRHQPGRRPQARGQRQGGLGGRRVLAPEGVSLPRGRGVGVPLPEPPDPGTPLHEPDRGRDRDARPGVRLALLRARPPRLEVGPGPRRALEGEGLHPRLRRQERGQGQGPLDREGIRRLPDDRRLAPAGRAEAPPPGRRPARTATTPGTPTAPRRPCRSPTPATAAS